MIENYIPIGIMMAMGIGFGVFMSKASEIFGRPELATGRQGHLVGGELSGASGVVALGGPGPPDQGGRLRGPQGTDASAMVGPGARGPQGGQAGSPGAHGAPPAAHRRTPPIAGSLRPGGFGQDPRRAGPSEWQD